MFSLTKESRAFLQSNSITIDNGFVNEGLIDYHFDDTPKHEFFHYYQLEKLYFQAIRRNVENRVITLKVDINRNNVDMFYEAVQWIKSQETKVKLQLKVRVDFYELNDVEKLSGFLNSNNVLEIDVYRNFWKIILDDSLWQSIKVLSGEIYSDFDKFKKL